MSFVIVLGTGGRSSLPRTGTDRRRKRGVAEEQETARLKQAGNNTTAELVIADQIPCWVEAGGTAGGGEQHERQQAGPFGLLGQQPMQHSGQPDRTCRGMHGPFTPMGMSALKSTSDQWFESFGAQAMAHGPTVAREYGTPAIICI